LAKQSKVVEQREVLGLVPMEELEYEDLHQDLLEFLGIQISELIDVGTIAGY
jgi:hypothetical protein